MARRKPKAKAKAQARPARPRPEVGGHALRRDWLILAGILLLGVLLRGAYLWERVQAPDFDSPGVDASFHDYWARGLAFGDWPRRGSPGDPRISTTPYIRPPGYPHFLALVYRLLGKGYLGPRVVQMALGLANCLLAFLFARR